MKKILSVLTLMTMLLALYQSSVARPANLALLNSINIATSADNTKIELKFDGRPGREKIQYQDDFVQLEFPGTYTDPAKQWLKVEDDIVKNIFVYQFDSNTVRLRLFTFDRAVNIRGRLSVSSTNNGLMISYGQKQAAANRQARITAKVDTKKGLKKSVAVPLEIILPEARVNVPQTEGAESFDGGAKAAQESTDNQDETPADPSPADQFAAGSGIEQDRVEVPPVKQNASDESAVLMKDSPGLTGSVIKMVTALGIVLSLLFAVVFFVKKYLGRKIGLNGQEQKIRVVTSAYLGPRKSIALVEVAGEKIVVGITATNISMLSKVGRDEDFGDVLKEQIKTEPENEKVELQDELWEKTQVGS